MLQGITKAVASDPAAYDLLEEDPGACMCRLELILLLLRLLFLLLLPSLKNHRCCELSFNQ